MAIPPFCEQQLLSSRRSATTAADLTPGSAAVMTRMEPTPPPASSDPLSPFAHLGRTRLRIELKKRGLSPSGLKNELLARLEEYMQKRKASGLSVETIEVPPPKLRGGRRRGQKRRQRQPDEDEDDPLNGGKSEDEVSRNTLHPENETPEGHGIRKQRGRKRRGNKDEDMQKSNKRVRGKRSSASLSAAPVARTTPISGKVFVKEVHHDMPPNSEIRCVEQFYFEGEHFRFTYRFWRGKVLRHRFEIEGGTFSFHPNTTTDPPTRCERPQPKPTEGQMESAVESKDEKGKEKDTEGTLVAFPSAASATKAENHVQKLILHWPSYIESSSLKAWQFDKTYPRLLMICPQPASTLSTSPADAQAKSDIILVSKHNGIFLPEHVENLEHRT